MSCGALHPNCQTSTTRAPPLACDMDSLQTKQLSKQSFWNSSPQHSERRRPDVATYQTPGDVTTIAVTRSELDQTIKGFVCRKMSY